MKKHLTIALVAHDQRKADMVSWAKYNAELLSQHHLVCTGTTGGLIKKAFDELGIQADITSGVAASSTPRKHAIKARYLSTLTFIIPPLPPH